MAISRPFAVGIAMPDLAERYPELGMRWWSRSESAFAGGYEWLGGRASFTSGVVTSGVGVHQAAFQVTLTKEQAALYLEGAFEFTPVEIGWWYFDGGDGEWRRIPRSFRGPLSSPKLRGRILAGLARTNPFPVRRERYNWDPVSHKERYPNDRGLDGIPRFASSPRVL